MGAPKVAWGAFGVQAYTETVLRMYIAHVRVYVCAYVCMHEKYTYLAFMYHVYNF